ncbi:helix-turn-helix transcriptional regulator [Tenacibaculum finnmarkense genomovar finnmarkense]|uniref:HTH cro/C1-type domain-containing protein n=1 Tax=Tenacibaculum finnmarkense genomovar ulcerans TaxID=2781388 RepID=A0A2I2M9U0_9FLAO|nr:helix-turn-helix transcriptional regulator [Tenacibaculum finnmarkense]MCG8185214.1 helix-turn-helix transcriptional regulator [Tenacibaculum finnmarkense genomovar finnmarkense]MCG8212079.1 helix-turn-helix transcriptional regulator [Tenacibaculum finnmarkense genomovar finnmarkense]MCG8230281.1 helix-turn-helix transcriptional regulator [Tenacibaculum finnmarkense genomovar finnmarkense]MCG8240701.1 helix-turn-helix transcriptional regulator [Tenacibaculum finnmarkense genomovar finnmarken
MQILRLKELLKEKSVSGKTLSDMVNVSENTISFIVTGKTQPRFELLLKIADVLDVDIKELFVSTKDGSSKIQVIINDKLKTFATIEDFKIFANSI